MVILVVALVCLGAGYAGMLVQGRRQHVYGIEGENLRPKPTTFALIGAVAAALLFLGGGLLVGFAAA